MYTPYMLDVGTVVTKEQLIEMKAKTLQAMFTEMKPAAPTYTITNYPVQAAVMDSNTFVIPSIQELGIPSLQEMDDDFEEFDDFEDSDPWDEDEESEDAPTPSVIHSPNQTYAPYSKEQLDTYAAFLNKDVYDKFLHFFDHPNEVCEYSAVGRTYVKKEVKPSQASTHSFWYSSDELPYVAKVNQPCYGQLGGIKPGQKNLYLWLINKSQRSPKDVFHVNHPYYEFVKQLRAGMFVEGTSEEIQMEVIQKLGWMLTPDLLGSWPSPVIASFPINFRDGWTMKNNDMLETMVSKLVYKGYSKANPYSIHTTHDYMWNMNTWAEIYNLMNQKFNKSIMSLPSYAEDPDYSCWDSPLNNLWSDHDIQNGGKVITGRATDMNWDPWVVRNRDRGDWYGRNNGNTRPKNDGEVQEELRKMLNTSEPDSFEKAQELVREYILKKVSEYHGTESNKSIAA